MHIEINHEQSHYAGYIDGKFVCSGDSFNEVERELIDILNPQEVTKMLGKKTDKQKDTVEVCRCVDCVYSKEPKEFDGMILYCAAPGRPMFEITLWDYCSHGRRK